MKKIVVLSVIWIVIQQVFPLNVEAFSWYSHATLKITIEANDAIYEWEYENPSSFEYEAGDRIVRGKKAKESFEDVLQYFDLTEASIEEKAMDKLEMDKGFFIERVVVQRRDRNYNLQTWLWQKEK